MDRRKILALIVCLLMPGVCPAVSGLLIGDMQSELPSDLLLQHASRMDDAGIGFRNVIGMQQVQAANVFGFIKPSAAADHIDPGAVTVRQHDQINRAESTATWRARLYYGNRQDVLISLYQQRNPVHPGKITQQDVPDTMLSLLAALEALTGLKFL